MWLSASMDLLTEKEESPVRRRDKVTLFLVLLMLAELREVPLDSIWGHELRGTKDIQGLGPESKGRIEQVYRLLAKRPKQGQKAGPVIVVEGEGREALNNAYVAIRNRVKYKIPPQTLMREKVPLSLFFYTYIGGRWVKLESVEIDKAKPTITRVTIKYRFISHLTLDSTVHFALIPIGEMPAGVVKVYVEQLPPIMDMKGTEGTMRDERQLVSDSTSFGVQPREKP